MRDFTGVLGASGGLADLDTRWTPEVGNSIVQELCNLVTDATGGEAELDPEDDTQVLTAIKAMIASALATTASRKRGLWEATISAGNTVYVPFDVAFPEGSQVIVVVTDWNASASATRDNWIQVQNVTEAGFYAVCQGSNTGGNQTLDGFYWMAEAMLA